MLDVLLSVSNILLECLGVAVFLAICIHLLKSISIGRK
jgi:hypothetical protein